MSIKHTPEDFVVEERLSPERQEALSQKAGPFALYRLKKERLTTPDALAIIAKHWRLKPTAFAYAGLKDKHARTYQHVTVKAGTKLPAEDAVDNWYIKRLGFVERPMTHQDIEGNAFRITVHGLSKTACDDMVQAADLLKAGEDEMGQATLRVTNFFGDQRFGSARHHQGFLARHLIKGQFESALKLAIKLPARKDRKEMKDFKAALTADWGDWKGLLEKLNRCPERRAIEHLAKKPKDFRGAFEALPYFFQQMSVYAYQSWLWNRTAYALVAAHCTETGPVMAADDPFGEMLFPTAGTVPEELAGCEVPLPSRKTELVAPYGEAMQAILNEEGIKLEELRIPGLRRPFFGHVTRTLFMDATEFKMDDPERDSAGKKAKRNLRKKTNRPTKAAKKFKRVLNFHLPRGSYATVLLRALGQ